MSFEGLVIQELKNQVLSFRVAELQMLLGYAGKNKTGKKQELQARALNLLLRGNLTLNVQNKIKELYRQRYVTQPDTYGVENHGQNNVERVEYFENQSTGNSHQSTVNRSILKPSDNSIHASQTQSQNRIVKYTDYPHQHSNYYTNMPRLEMTSSQTSAPTRDAKPYLPSRVSQTHSNSTNVNAYADVKFRNLPFFELCKELVAPTTLLPSPNVRFQETSFQFQLSAPEADKIAKSWHLGGGDYTMQIHLRFCLLDANCEQEDHLPPGLCVKVNSKVCLLPPVQQSNKPGLGSKRLSKPVNITNLCRISPVTGNHIHVTWDSDLQLAYAMSVSLVKKLTSAQLLAKISNKGVRTPEYTRSLIKEKLSPTDNDCEIAAMSLKGSLICPLGKVRMQMPCRAVTCPHIQCFDARFYIQINEKKPEWTCPICDRPAQFSHLLVDGFFKDIISEAPANCTEVEFSADGSWMPILPKKSSEGLSLTPSKRLPSREENRPAKSLKKAEEPTIIVLDSDDDDDDDEAIESSDRYNFNSDVDELNGFNSSQHLNLAYLNDNSSLLTHGTFDNPFCL